MSRLSFIHRKHHVEALLLIVTVFFSSYLYLIRFQPSLEFREVRGSIGDGGVSKPLMLTTTKQQDDNDLTIRPGDLPGYTGWARPSETLAGWFENPSPLTNDLVVHRNATFRIYCGAPACRGGGSLFFVRAYGRAVLPGRVIDHRNGTYDVVVFPFDAGIYHLEVVLSFSETPPLDSFPLGEDQKQQPVYEGYLLPGFPFPFEVHGFTKEATDVLPRCTTRDLLETREDSAIEKGRWIVQDKVNSRRHPYIGNRGNQRGKTTILALRDYQKGKTSLGLRMDYAPRSCALLPSSQLHKAFQCAKDRNLHLIFMGDSNSRMQLQAFNVYWNLTSSRSSSHSNSKLPNIRTTRIHTTRGLNFSLPTIANKLQEMRRTAQTEVDTDYFILFNAGLHDITQRCARPHAIPGGASCTEQYRVTLRELVKLIDAFPAKLKVFQTTTAGWPRYGNFGFAWPPATKQMLPKDPNFVSHFNKAAWQVLSNMTGDANSSSSTASSPSISIPIMDAYWITLARPDHREVDIENALGKHLVHGGPEVVDALVRQWTMMVLESVCGKDY